MQPPLRGKPVFLTPRSRCLEDGRARRLPNLHQDAPSETGLTIQLNHIKVPITGSLNLYFLYQCLTIYLLSNHCTCMSANIPYMYLYASILDNIPTHKLQYLGNWSPDDLPLASIWKNLEDWDASPSLLVLLLPKHWQIKSSKDLVHLLLAPLKHHNFYLPLQMRLPAFI